MEFKYFNSNPDASTFKSGKPKAWYRDDSSIRAISAATKQEWVSVYDALVNIGRKNHDMPQAKTIVNEYLISNDFSYETYGKPASGVKRPTVKEFVAEHNNGTYILYLRDYYVCVENGTVLNTVKLDDESVYSYWRMNK